jgi:hypothetical protein
MTSKSAIVAPTAAVMKALKPSPFVRILMTCKTPNARQNVLPKSTSKPINCR